jgi:cytochrome c553
MRTNKKSAANHLHRRRIENCQRGLVTALVCMLGAPIWFTPLRAIGEAVTDELQPEVPAWVFPLNPPGPASGAPYDDAKQLHVPNSKLAFTEAQLNDLFAAPDWHPDSHAAMPSVVSRGNSPEVYACGFCHTPGGQGRPENASLAGLPAPYIIQQVADFKSGTRKSAWHAPYRPADLMIRVATRATADEVAAAAQYFSAQQLRPRVVVVERSRVPQSHVVGWVYVEDGRGGDEPLGERLLEFAPDASRHENRDDEMRYIAYVPAGSIGRGKSIAQSGSIGSTVACMSCHGPSLRGTGLVPPIAGRSPTYILRQLLAFQTGARAGVTGQPMSAVVAKLKTRNMIDVAAYAASLPP